MTPKRPKLSRESLDALAARAPDGTPVPAAKLTPDDIESTGDTLLAVARDFASVISPEEQEAFRIVRHVLDRVEEHEL